jgi:hypothetical protein
MRKYLRRVCFPLVLYKYAPDSDRAFATVKVVVEIIFKLGL